MYRPVPSDWKWGVARQIKSKYYLQSESLAHPDHVSLIFELCAATMAGVPWLLRSSRHQVVLEVASLVRFVVVTFQIDEPVFRPECRQERQKSAPHSLDSGFGKCAAGSATRDSGG